MKSFNFILLIIAFLLLQFGLTAILPEEQFVHADSHSVYIVYPSASELRIGVFSCILGFSSCMVVMYLNIIEKINTKK